MAYPRSFVRTEQEYQTEHENELIESFYRDAERDLERGQKHRRHSQQSANSWYVRTLLVALAIMPLIFGSVHEEAQLIFQALFFALLGIVCIKHWPILLDLYSGQASCFRSRRVFVLLVGLCCYVVIQPVLIGVSRAAHPILGALPWYNNPQEFLACSRTYLGFLAIFVLTQVLCKLESNFIYKAARLISRMAGVVAFIALAHWLYDNGKLFWVFEPEHIISSNRARWPFVSANNLGQFLILAGFPLFGVLALNFANVIGRTQWLMQHRKGALTAFITRRRQRQFVSLAFDCALFFAVVIAVCASLSRDSWLGATATILTVLLMRLFRRSNLAHNKVEKPRRNTRGNAAGAFDRLLSKIADLGLGKYLNYLGFSVVVLGVVFFLNEQGREVVADRIEYGILHSKDDVRLQFYSDSIALFRKSPLIGIGAGNFAKRFPEVASPVVGELNIEYLHSDPLQSLIELGMLGGLFEVGIALVLILGTVRLALLNSTQQLDYIFLGLFCGLLAAVIASMVDFPFRVPAIVAFFAVQLAICCYYLDERERFTENKSHSY